MALITTSDIQNLLRPGLKSVFMDYNTYKDQWSELFHSYTSDKMAEYDQEMSMTGIAAFKEQAGPVQSSNMGQANFTVYEHQWAGLQFSMTRQMIEDNLYKDMWPKGAVALRESLLQYKNTLGANVFNLGFSSSRPIGDGQPFFSTAHPTQGGTVSNTLSIPTQLNETSLQDICINIQAFLSASGLKISYMPRKLAVPRNLQFTADVLLGSKFRTGTANNDISALYNMNMIPEGYTVNQFFTGNNWFILTSLRDNGLKYFMRTPIDINNITDQTTQNVTVIATERYSFGTSNFRAAAGVQGA